VLLDIKPKGRVECYEIDQHILRRVVDGTVHTECNEGMVPQHRYEVPGIEFASEESAATEDTQVFVGKAYF
jgi:hypothetical protein